MLLDEVAGYLTAQTTTFTVGAAGNLTLGFMPDSAPAPDTVATLYETGGLAPTYTFSSGPKPTVMFEHPRLQAIIRSTSYRTARTLAETVFTTLDGVTQTRIPTSTGPLYLDITAVQSPFSIGRDDNGRHMVSINFDVRKQRFDSSNRLPATITGAATVSAVGTST